MSEDMTREQLDELTVPELKEKLEEAGKPISGKKDELIDRLLEPADDDLEVVEAEGDAAEESEEGEDWQENQDKETKAESRDEEVAGDDMVKVFMKTDYRSFAKKGEVYTVDQEKAEELVRLNRAEWYDKKKHKKAPKAN